MKQVRSHTRLKYMRGLMNGRVNFTVHGVAAATSSAPYVRYILALKTRVSRSIGKERRRGRGTEKGRERERERETNTERESAENCRES